MWVSVVARRKWWASYCELGEEQQIIAITHQSQVAAQTISIFGVQDPAEKAQSHLKILSGDEQVQNWACMSGEVNITEDTLKHA